MRPVFAAVLGFSVALLVGFTTISAPARHPSYSGVFVTPAVYVFDPHVNGANPGGIPNITAITPSSACSQTQSIGIYDDGGSTGVNCIDSYSGTLTVTPAAPTTPTVVQGTSFMFAADSGFPAVSAVVDGFTGLVIPDGMFSFFGHYGATVNWDVSCALVESWGFNNIAYVPNGSLTAQTSGTVGNKSWANTSLYTRSKVVTYVTAASTNTAAFVKAPASAQLTMWRGNSAGAGGFLWWARASMDDTFANSRTAMGLFNAASLVATNDPNVATDSVYFGCNSGDSNLSICSNDNSGTATCNTLGASFPCTTDGAFYDFWFAAAPNGGEILWAITRLDSAAGTGGRLSADLPRNTVGLQWYTYLNTGSAATSIKLGFLGECTAANY